MVSIDASATSAIRCHIGGLVFGLARGGYSTCGAFVTKEHKFFAFRRFTCLALCFSLPWAPFAESVSAPYQVTLPAEQKHEAERIMTFDIAPQSLLTALRAYTDVTGQAVLVDDTLAAGRQSPGVQGVFDTTEALRALLAGTGLVASYSSDQAFTLKLATPNEDDDEIRQERVEGAVSGGDEAVIERYAGTIQRPIEAALCRSDDTRPGTYRLAMQIWIAPSGRVEKTRLLTPGDDHRRHDDVRRALSELMLDPPPQDMPQPITLLLLPQHAHASACASLSESAR